VAVQDWQIQCDRETFEKCRGDAKFVYIVTLARAVNALRFVHSAMIHAGEGNAPEAMRARLNSYLFASAILYEGIKLIRAMNQTFKDDETFQKGLRLFLRDKTAQSIERAHLDPARNGAVFHFLPKRFGETIKSASADTCIFVAARGETNKDVYYPFADVVAGEILVGYASDTEEFYEQLRDAMINTRELVIRFADGAEHLISYHLKQWGFKIAMIPQASAPGPQQTTATPST
jgi:hypothetical protein